MSLETGTTIPSVTLYNASLEAKKTDELSTGKPRVFLFYPASFTGVCETELCTFQDSIARYNELGADIYGISVDLPFSQKVFAEQNDIDFPLLSDFNKDAIEAFGVIFEDLKGLKNVANRAVFVFDASGKLTWKWIADAPTNEPPYDEVEKAVEALAGAAA